MSSPLILALLIAAIAARAQEDKVRKDLKDFEAKKAAEACHSEHSSRWAIKTMADPDAEATAKTEPQDATVKELHALKLPPKTHSPTRWDEEKRLRRVKGVLLGWQLEEDEDIHLVLADADDHGQAMIIESPKPGCGVKSSFVENFKSVRQALQDKLGRPAKPMVYYRLKPPVPVTVVGPAFFDIIHGKMEGESANGIEIHPILSLDFGR